MSSSRSPVGPLGLALLGLAAAAGLALGIHGWSARHTPAALGSVGAAAAATGAGSSHKPAAHATAGPLLNSQSYAQYAFQVWPGRLSAAAQSAEIGLSIKVSRAGRDLEVTAGVNGQPVGAPHAYPAGARVYVIEAALGDDSGNTDYNLGDDGVVVTSADGRIVQ